MVTPGKDLALRNRADEWGWEMPRNPTVMSGLAVKHGLEEVLDTTTAAMGIVEELRKAVVPDRLRGK